MNRLLNSIQHYIPLSSADEAIIATLVRRHTFTKGEHLLQAGQVCKSVFFIEKGLVRYYTSIEGEEKTSYFNKEGEFVCDYASFLPQKPSLTNIQVLEDATIYSISQANMDLLYQQVEQGERFGRLAISEVFVSAIHQINSLYTDPPEVRYQTFLARFPEIAQRIPQYYIASYVGIKPQSLSRIRKRMAQAH
ncbi:putative transcriptional regulator, Crp/Fnr family [Fibrella aestuarina BUZ 2]|uniref:Putative transcriptional regulator, Crp/Fnr family n=1 Tax=Fibrella aestuarina BUZ 2 TaxID=1166018 RepID=I0K823_9BACT|nr:Crp/Fnr family transcriptional regulator [Fibrella aestuarina]CCH00276.1 putative transcriptional regulator, Crp/Fnr family [Fibrella aestuarina BUZ 2]